MISQKGYKKLRWLRICVSLIIMVVMAVMIALGYHTFLDSWQLVPAVLAGTGQWLMLWAVVTAFFGRLYCSTACPLGTLQDILLHLRKRKHGFFYASDTPMLRWLFVLVIALAAILGISIIVAALSPSAAFERIVKMSAYPFIKSAAYSILTLFAASTTLAVVAIMAIWRGRLLCNTICPVGTVLGAFSRFSLFQVDINTDKCIGCGLCTAKCKAQCIDPSAHTVDFTRCVVCFDCMASCPNDAIGLRRGKHQLQWPMLQTISTEPTAASAPKAISPAKPVSKTATVNEPQAN